MTPGLLKAHANLNWENYGQNALSIVIETIHLKLYMIRKKEKERNK